MTTKPTSTKTIVLDFLRHGEPEGGDILRGRVNPVLTPLGWSQMRKATGLQTDYRPSETTPKWTHIISSPLFRCSEFAKAAAKKVQLTPCIEDRWLEIDYGDWDGMLIKDWRVEAAEQFKAFRKDLSALAPPNGEAYPIFKERILAALLDLESLPDESHVLVVTHGGVLRVVLPKVLGMPFNKSFPLHIPFACFSRIRLDVMADKTNLALLFHNGAECAAGA